MLNSFQVMAEKPAQSIDIYRYYEAGRRDRRKNIILSYKRNARM